MEDDTIDINDAEGASAELERRFGIKPKDWGREVTQRDIQWLLDHCPFIQVVAGGGVALLYATKVLDKLEGDNEDQQVGINIIRKAIQGPVRQIAENAGFDGAVVAGKLLEQKDTDFGFDAQNGEYTNLVKAGVIDKPDAHIWKRSRMFLLPIGLAGSFFGASVLLGAESAIDPAMLGGMAILTGFSEFAT